MSYDNAKKLADEKRQKDKDAKKRASKIVRARRAERLRLHAKAIAVLSTYDGKDGLTFKNDGGSLILRKDGRPLFNLRLVTRQMGLAADMGGGSYNYFHFHDLRDGGGFDADNFEEQLDAFMVGKL